MRTIADSYIEEGLNKGMLQGIAIGKNEGIAIGKNEGIAIGVKNMAIRMMEGKADIKFISSVTGLSSNEILKLNKKT